MKLLSWLCVPLLAGAVLAADMPSPDMPMDQFPTDQFATDQLPWNFPADQKPMDVTGKWSGKYESIDGKNVGLIDLLIEARDGWTFKGKLQIGEVTFSIVGVVDADGRFAIAATDPRNPELEGVDPPNPDKSALIICKSPKADPPNSDRVLIVGTIRDNGRNGIGLEGTYLAMSGDHIGDMGKLLLVNNE